MQVLTTAFGETRDFLDGLGAAELPHPGGTLLEHLERVRALLAEWGASEEVQLAGLCHGVYGTGAFGPSLLSVAERHRLAEVVGVQAEALVYLYASCDRDVVYPRLARERPPRFRDRFTDSERLLSPTDARALMELTAANELDVMTQNEEFAARHADELRRFFDQAADLLSASARWAWRHDVNPPGPPAGITVTRIDHLVLTVADLARSTAFYAKLLGMQPIVFGDGRRALTFGQGKINLHLAGAEHPPHAAQPLPGSGDLCFVTASPVDQILRHLSACETSLLEGPVRRTGALGPMLSCYVRDPDGNLVEISTYDTPHGLDRRCR